MTNQIVATYTKLKNGQWGVRAPAGVTVGATITVTKRDGSSKTETVAAILWAGIARDGREASLVSIVPTGSTSRPRATSRHFRPCGYPGCSKGYCDECDGEGA